MIRRSLAVRASRAIARYTRAESGQVAIIFALALIPLLFASGAAVDYMRWSASKTQLDAALDAAILSVVSQKSNTITPGQIVRMEQQFREEAAKLPDVDVTSFTPEPLLALTSIGLKASYKANVKTTLASLMNVSHLVASGTASAQRKVAEFVDFYLLLDNSPSMGLAATDADITALKNATRGNSRLSGSDKTDGCAFACHLHTFDNKGNITGDDPNDFYSIAKKKNITLRINRVRDAVTNLVDTAKSAMTLPSQYRMELWTFAENASRISQLTTNLDQTKTNAMAIDLAYSLYGEPDNQTAFERALSKMTTVIPASGDGVTATSPIRFLFFVTDGVQDTPVDGSVSNASQGYMINGNRFISPINPANCQAMKDKGIRIGIIYTTYLPLYNNGFYNSYVKPFESKIPTTLRACASSDDLFFQVATGGDINDAMERLFRAALASVRLTD